MNKNKSLKIEETFNLAVKNHQEGKTDIAQELYNQVLKIDPSHSQSLGNIGVIFTNLKEHQKAKECFEKAIEIDPNNSSAHNNLGVISKDLGENQKAKEFYEKAIEIDPNHLDAHNNLGVIFKVLGENQKAKDCFEKAIEIDPNHVDAHNNLGVVFEELKEYQKAKECYEKAIKINPNHVDAHNNLGVIFKDLGENQKAKECYEKAIEINPIYVHAHNNLGVIFKVLGENQKAKECYEKAIEINPIYVHAHNNLGNIFKEFGEHQKAKDCFEKAIEIDPNHVDAYWNSHALSTDINEALLILKKLYKIDSSHIKSKIMISALEGYKGDFKRFNELLNSSHSNHPYTRSIKWIFSLPKLPNIFFDRWLFFDAIIKLTDNSRPFYEFGVWNASSFQYLINTFKKGFGFDTFSGLPETWHNKPKGTYSSFGVIPKIEGGEFIVGKFEDTLSNFFQKKNLWLH